MYRTKYSYDARGQLLGADYDYQDGEAYSYDANGNRSGDGHVVGDHNRLLSDGTYRYEYDGEGNRTKRVDLATGEVTEYLWDHRNRLIAVVERLSENGPAVQSVEYVYDSQNRWIAKSIDPDGYEPEEAADTHFVYQGNQIVLQIDGEGEVTNRYLWGPAVDQILADEQVQPDSSSEVLWTLTDHLNTVRDLAEYDPETEVTSIVNHIVYDAFGRVAGQSDPSVTTLFGFTSRPFDADTGLQNNLNRWYDAETGSWISVDPAGFVASDANLYRYVGNEVTMKVDPAGLDDRWGWWGSGAGATAAGFFGIGKVLTYPGRLIPGTGEFWRERDEALQELYDRSNIGGTGWQTTSEVGSHGAAMAMTAGLFAPSSAAGSAAKLPSTIVGGTAMADDIAIAGGKITMTVTVKGKLPLSFVKNVKQAFAGTGATSVEVNTGLVMNPSLAKDLSAAALSGSKMYGGTVTQVTGINGPMPVFKILIQLPK